MNEIVLILSSLKDSSAKNRIKKKIELIMQQIIKMIQTDFKNIMDSKQRKRMLKRLFKIKSSKWQKL